MKKLCLPKYTYIFFTIIFSFSGAFSQINVGGNQTNGSENNNIVIAVPFLLITPDARTGAMANAGVAIAGDGNSSSINPAKLAFLENRSGIALSYTPWLKNLVPDVNLTYLSGFYRLGNRNVIGGSLRYFSLGDVQLTDINQQPIGVSNPNELAVDFTFSRSFGPGFSLGGSVRFVNSNLSAGNQGNGQISKAGTAVSMDIGGLYVHQSSLFQKQATISFGLNLSNIGTKMSYSDGGQKYFLPANLKLGGAATIIIDEYSSLSMAFDLNKLLVPTQPVYDPNGNIVQGRDPERSVPSGIFGSFSDAPGGFTEELKEVGFSAGFEYWYNKQFGLRVGYNYENPEKGNSRYVTLGAGLKYNTLNFDFAYLIADQQTSPLANTLRFGISLNIN